MDGNTESMVAFRTSRKGYSKEDVNRYIEQINIRFSQEKEVLESRIRELESSAAKTGNAEKIFEENSKLSQSLTEKEEELKSLRASLAKSNAELDAARVELDRVNAELSGSKTELEGAEGIPEQSNEMSFTDASTRLGQILLKANLDADKILADAEAEARRRKEEAQRSAGQVKFDAAVTARVMTEQVKSRLGELTRGFTQELSAAVGTATGEYQKLICELKTKAEIVSSKAEEKLVL